MTHLLRALSFIFIMNSAVAPSFENRGTTQVKGLINNAGYMEGNGNGGIHITGDSTTAAAIMSSMFGGNGPEPRGIQTLTITPSGGNFENIKMDGWINNFGHTVGNNKGGITINGNSVDLDGRRVYVESPRSTSGIVPVSPSANSNFQKSVPPNTVPKSRSYGSGLIGRIMRLFGRS